MCEQVAADIGGRYAGDGNWGTETRGCLQDNGVVYWNRAGLPLESFTDNIVEDDEFPVCMCSASLEPEPGFIVIPARSYSANCD